MEGPLTHLRVHHMTYHLNRKLYVGQDLLDLLLKKQSTWGQGEIYQPSSAINVFCGFFQLCEEILFLTLQGEEYDQVLPFVKGEKMT